jgi:A/G-specific adenine glycosylase
MLQQTTVAAVIPYFERFTASWPNFAALATAPDADVMAAWAGLGYYSRARNLLKCARVVASEHRGKLPCSADQLAKLPGIGPYTAAAIAAIAFGERVAVVDANVERVVSRLFAIETPLPLSKPAIREAVNAITPSARPGDFAQAMMDLGAGICSTRSPQCLICPLRLQCKAQALGIAETLPRKAAKRAKPERSGTAWWIERDDHVWLIRRPPHGMLGGMRALPDDGWNARRDGDSQPPFKAKWRMVDGAVMHVFTHFRLTLKIAVTSSRVKPETLGTGEDGGEWWPVKSLDSAGLPTLFSKAAKLANSAGR